MKKYLSRRKKKTILTALALGLCLLTPWHRAEAVTSYTTPNGLFRLDYYGPGESVTWKRYAENSTEEDMFYLTSQGELPDWQKERLNFAVDYWDGVLKHTKTSRQPADLAVMVYHDYNNAGALSSFSDVDMDGHTVSVATPNAVLNHGRILAEEDGPAGVFFIGTPVFPPDGEQTRYDTPLPQDSQIALAFTVIHEFGHAVGISSSDVLFYDLHFSEKADLFESRLYDWRGMQAQPGMEIQTANREVETEPFFDLPRFVVNWPDGAVPYFSGRHVSDVLEGAELRGF